MEKCLKIRFSNGDLFAISTRIIAEDRAKYYATIDGYDKGSYEWESEVQYALNDVFELKDWMSNNMDWSDLEPYARKVEDAGDLDYEENWTEAEINLCDESEND